MVQSSLESTGLLGAGPGSSATNSVLVASVPLCEMGGILLALFQPYS